MDAGTAMRLNDGVEWGEGGGTEHGPASSIGWKLDGNGGGEKARYMAFLIGWEVRDTALSFDPVASYKIKAGCLKDRSCKIC
jgi:hypothetical protein